MTINFHNGLMLLLINELLQSTECVNTKYGSASHAMVWNSMKLVWFRIINVKYRVRHHNWDNPRANKVILKVFVCKGFSTLPGQCVSKKVCVYTLFWFSSQFSEWLIKMIIHLQDTRLNILSAVKIKLFFTTFTMRIMSQK